MKVAIIGLGFVGNALNNGISDSVDIFKVDPKLNTSILDLQQFSPEIIFICAPTPMDKEGNQDISIVNSILDEINEYSIKSTVVLKSTTLPNNITKMLQRNKRLIINPEFLREANAMEDFINSDLIIFGGEIAECKKVSEFYINHTKCIQKDHIFTDAISASLIKYAINSFLATKVIFFNQLKELFNESNANDSWDNFIKYIAFDKRIGNSHMQVPGPDNRFGFGGACFPKDTKALLDFAITKELDFGLLAEVIKINNEIRKSYNTTTDREKEQNIEFN